jgi:signal transduction histidine kinase
MSQNSKPDSGPQNFLTIGLRDSLFILVLIVAICLTRFYGYLLFHSLTEMFSAVIGIGIFMIAWNARRFMDNSYFLLIGVAFLFISLLGVLHTLSYKGMGVFQEENPANLPTQLWTALRYLTALSFLAAPFFIRKQVQAGTLIAGYSLVTALLLLSIFYWRIFPECYIEGSGLTEFKKNSAYIIAFIFLAAGVLLFRQRREFDVVIFRLLVIALAFMIATELFFSLYTDVYGIANMIGHILMIISFFLIYKAFIEIGLSRPYNLLFRNLKKSEEGLLERAGELSQVNVQLKKEAADRQKAENDLSEHRKYLEQLIGERTSQLLDSQKDLEKEISERKRAEEELRVLSTNTLQLLDEERRNISRELHDQAGQTLTVLNLLLAKIKRSLDEKAVQTLADVEESQTIVRELMQQIRALSSTLHPSMLDNIGLIPTLEWYTREFTSRTGIKIHFTSSGEEGNLPARLRITTYRIIQEGLTNIARYAETNEAFIRVEFKENTLKIYIEDKGKGFDLSAVASTSSGITGMRERVNALEGKLEVISSPGKGTRIEVNLPTQQPSSSPPSA